MPTLQATPQKSSDLRPLTKEEATSVFEKRVRRYLKMSPDEFCNKLDSGYFNKHPRLARRLDSVLFYMPLVRR